MSLIKLLKREKYILMGRCKEDDEYKWIELDTYTQPIPWKELKDELLEMAEENDCTSFYLKTSGGRKVWVRHLRKNSDQQGGLGNIKKSIELIKSVMEAVKQITPQTDPFATFREIVAMFSSLRNFCNEYPEMCGSKGDVVTDIIRMILQSRGLQQSIPPMPLPQPEQAAVQTPVQQPQVNPIVAEEIDKYVPEDVKAKIDSIVIDALAKSSEIVKTPCEVEGLCTEGGDQQ